MAHCIYFHFRLFSFLLGHPLSQTAPGAGKGGNFFRRVVIASQNTWLLLEWSMNFVRETEWQAWPCWIRRCFEKEAQMVFNPLCSWRTTFKIPPGSGWCLCECDCSKDPWSCCRMLYSEQSSHYCVHQSSCVCAEYTQDGASWGSFNRGIRCRESSDPHLRFQPLPCFSLTVI